MLLSVIVPCYNEEENVPIFYEEMMKNSAFLEQEKLEQEKMLEVKEDKIRLTKRGIDVSNYVFCEFLL